MFVSSNSTKGRDVKAENGGPAIETVSSAYVDIFNNSTWSNPQTFTSFPTPPSYAGGASANAVTSADPSGYTWANGSYGSASPL